ncbi:hypothetical protein BDP27DRAFT_1449835 [Rhodocollybia butyracea]|uniref:F-box domain-containing protein n=1 Tax=Rhodocollybia butyracea TaxID=206335 RepID=A0A9P5PMW5_9AGAR|nr:hypothetical protein BDP27DRAFT_1449835 [Rhodocollybia butyracea]
MDSTTYRNSSTSTLWGGLNGAADELAPSSSQASRNGNPVSSTQVDVLPAPRGSRTPSGANLISSDGWRSLPVELLLQIFPHCLPSEFTILPPSLIMEAPLALLFVCQKWRAVALSTAQLWNSPRIRLTPELWGSLRMSLPTSYHRLLDEELKKQRHGIKQRLNRAGSFPLSLSLIIRHEPKPELVDFQNDTFDLVAFLMRYSSRFVDLTIFSLSTMCDFSQSAAILGTRFPALESMSIVHWTAGGDHIEGRLSTLMPISEKLMPKLHKLYLDGFSSPVISHLTRTHNWSPNIKHFILASMSVLDNSPFGPADILSILSQNTHLHSFHAAVTLNSIYPIHRSLQRSSSVLNLPSLLHLKLQFIIPPNDILHAHPDPDIHRLFKSIFCPSLKTLCIVYAGIPSLTEVPFLPWLSPSNPRISRIDQLRELKLEVSMTSRALTECLIHLPSSLRILEIVDLGQVEFNRTGMMCGHTVRDSHLDLLTRKHDSVDVDICPSLKIFRFVVSRFLVSDGFETQLENMGVSLGGLQRFVDSRSQSTGNGHGTRKGRTLRECEVLLSPSSSRYYTLDLP